MSKETAVRSGRQSPGTGFFLFLFLTAVYLLSYSGGFHAIDEVSVTAMTESLVKDGRVSTNQIWWSQNWTPSQGRIGPDGNLYSKKGVGSALLGAPFYWLALRVPEMTIDLEAEIGLEVGAVRALMLANALVTALTGWLVYACVQRLGYRPVVAVLTALAFGLGTMAWPYARYFFSEPLTALGLMAGLWGLLVYGQSNQVRYAALAGIGLGMALLAKVANVVACPLFLVYGFWIGIRQRKGEAQEGPRELVRFAVAFLLPQVAAGLVLAAYNVARTGHLLDLGYAADETFATPLWQGLAGLLFSPGKSLFLYSPILLAALFGIPALLRRDRAMALLSLGVVAVYPLVYARWFMWWGGWSWGPRFLVPVLPFLSLFLAPAVDWVLRPSRWWAKGLLAALALLSLWVQILGVAVDFNRYLLILYERGMDSGEVNFLPGLSPLLGHWTLLRTALTPASSADLWDLAWARDLAAGVGQSQGGADLSRLLWPLALVAAALVGWRVARRTGHAGRWLLVAGGIGLLAVAMVMVARLPAPADEWQVGGRSLSATLQEAAQPGDVMIVDLLPYGNHLESTTALLDRYKAAPAYWGWARQEPVSAERQALLAALGQAYDRLWLVLDTTPEADPASTTERWLDANAFRVDSRWLSPAMRLVRYQLPAGSPDDDPQADLHLRLGDRLWLRGYSLALDKPFENDQTGSCRDTGLSCGDADPLEIHAGDVLLLSLFWQAERLVSDDSAVFIQLLDQEGRLRAQVDRPPVGGFRPTSTWQPGELIRDNYGLQLPSDLPPGPYQLITGLYLPASMERLAISTADGVPLGDHAPLTSVIVVGGNRP